ncbi:hypothetical protein AALO_G00044490 [Alosa alosa]|uniref:Uncharacterized protein n=1 Tax=Alosa alosa TaxID=278164 RepID=A0AAV6H8E8_9TELE|nr:hypothetical protein AALO_G00044490 [Alosa alosa]
MSVQSNSGSGGSLEGTPSWSQLSTSPTPGLLSQQHSAALAKAKEECQWHPLPPLRLPPCLCSQTGIHHGCLGTLLCT